MFDYKKYFFDIWTKGKHLKKLTVEEEIIYEIMQTHYEYYFHYECADTDDFKYDDNAPNPFIHISLHLTLKKLMTNDSYNFINEAYNRLLKKTNLHNAEHLIIDKIINSFSISTDNNQENISNETCININDLKKQIELL